MRIGAAGWLGSTAGVTEDAAREGERKEPPPELKAQMEGMSKLVVGEPRFLGLRQPWLYSP